MPILKEQIVKTLKPKPDILMIGGQFIAQPENIPVLFDIIDTEKGSVKFTCEKVIRKISETNPEIIYPYFDSIARLLDNNNNFILWGSIITISNIICVDTENKFEKIYEKYFSFLFSPSMITAANVASNAYKIILCKMEYEKDITSKLLNIKNNTYYYKNEISPECKNVLYGHMLDCFYEYYHVSSMQSQILNFAKDQLNNTRPYY